MKNFSTQDVVNYGLLVADTFNTYAKNKSSMTPEITSDSLIGQNLIVDGYLVANDCLISDIFKPVKDQCFYGVLAHYKDNPEKYITLIRGTGNTLEWIDDVKAAPHNHPVANSGFVEDGFFDIYNSMSYLPALATKEQNNINQTLSINAAQAISQVVSSHNGTLTITGHSLGSAIATYLMYDITRKPEMHDKTDMCLFASPKPGNKEFIEAFQQATENYVVYNYSSDIVPQVPPSLIGYESLKDVKLLTPDNSQAIINDNILSNHHVVCYCAMLDYKYTKDWRELLIKNGDAPDCILGEHIPTTKIGDPVVKSTVSNVIQNIKTIRGSLVELFHNHDNPASTPPKLT